MAGFPSVLPVQASGPSVKAHSFRAGSAVQIPEAFHQPENKGENRLGRTFYEHHGFKIADEREEDFFGYMTLQIKYKLTRKL